MKDNNVNKDVKIKDELIETKYEVCEGCSG
jgi:hypothetical protein